MSLILAFYALPPPSPAAIVLNFTDGATPAPTTIQAQIGLLSPGALVELFELDATAIGGPQLWFHAGTNKLGAAVVWQGQTYQPYPVQAEGFEIASTGALPRPSLTVANVSGLITGYMQAFSDLLGATITRRRTLVQYLDAVNFPGAVNPTADPTQQLPEEIWIIDRKAAETKQMVVFELAANYDVAGVMLPRRQIIQNVCTWQYRSAECSWVPDPTTGPWYDATDTATTEANDACSKRLTGCECRFGSTNPLPYGGFPAAGLIRQ